MLQTSTLSLFLSLSLSLSLSLLEIQSLVLQGRVSDAVRVVQASYPGLLENSPELLFKLRCRQFVEMIGGCDTADLLTPPSQEPRLSCHSELSCSSGEGEEGVVAPPPGSTPAGDSPFANGEVSMNGGGLEESAMEVDGPASTGTAGESSREDKGQQCTTQSWYAAGNDSNYCPAEAVDFDRNPVAIERLLTFGRDLQALYSRLTATHPNEQLKATLQVSYSERLGVWLTSS